MNTHIEQAIENFRANAGRYRKPERYYRGEHDLAFATDKFRNAFGSLFREFALNLCPAVCEALRDKLKIRGFSVEEVSRGFTAEHAETAEFLKTEITGANPKSKIQNPKSSVARRIWQLNRMGRLSGEIHKEAIKTGDAYAIVWPDAAGNVTIYPNKAASCTAIYDDETPGRILWAAKYWKQADNRTRLNLFYPDRIEKYISREKQETTLPEAKEFSPMSNVQGPMSKSETLDIGHWTQDTWTVDNPFGVVPVFHFANNADLGMPGISEIEAAIPVQDGLNKSVLDMLVAMEFSSFRQRWAVGIEVEYDSKGKPVAPFESGIQHLWISENPQTKFGDFQSADLEQFLKVKESFRVDMACVTGTPMYYFMQTPANFPSGESLKKAETRFIAKVRDRQESFGQTWEDIMSFALMAAGCGRGIRLIADWEDPAPLSEKEFLENILMKKELGISNEQALLEAGYGTADVKRMLS